MDWGAQRRLAAGGYRWPRAPPALGSSAVTNAPPSGTVAGMVKHQLGLQRRPTGDGLQSQLAMLSEALREAVLAACTAYAALGVPYALVGGLAAGAHGRPRFTKDIDFLVGDEAFSRHGLIVSFAQPMPLQAGEMAIDPIPLPENPLRKAVLRQALENVEFDTTTGQRIPILGATWLSYMKLASPRGKDRDDVVCMMQAGRVDRDALRAAVGGDRQLEARLAEALVELALVEG
jgi:hypothetical protein